MISAAAAVPAAALGLCALQHGRVPLVELLLDLCAALLHDALDVLDLLLERAQLREALLVRALQHVDLRLELVLLLLEALQVRVVLPRARALAVLHLRQQPVHGLLAPQVLDGLLEVLDALSRLVRLGAGGLRLGVLHAQLLLVLLEGPVPRALHAEPLEGRLRRLEHALVRRRP
eukprot:CAMPEP_0118876726 /NCGR_PEP_ID=MMETSP1163-20130328/17301_1 /TAXON_ID=124430 /ORGANISM="Phaeomonas parva, Strain CCMP2877" /LENGTH=174 /DNA_ID=CAMNT_0006812357 /DNA_START=619 /DNA_END=1139 /DNA_ORIENTATION=+